MEPNNPPVVNSNPLPPSPTPAAPAPTAQPAKKHAFLYALSALMLVFSIGYATFTLGQQPQSVSSNADEVKSPYGLTQKEEWTKLLASVPKNPDEVVATASASTGETVTLQSDEPADYDEVTFTWSGDKAVEPGSKIGGYVVYFGPKNTEIPYPEEGYKDSVNPKEEGIFVPENTFTAKDLEKGKTYYLYVQTFTRSNNKNPYAHFGMEKLSGFMTLPAKKLFTYIYQ